MGPYLLSLSRVAPVAHSKPPTLWHFGVPSPRPKPILPLLVLLLLPCWSVHCTLGLKVLVVLLGIQATPWVLPRGPILVVNAPETWSGGGFVRVKVTPLSSHVHCSLIDLLHAMNGHLVGEKIQMTPVCRGGTEMVSSGSTACTGPLAPILRSEPTNCTMAATMVDLDWRGEGSFVDFWSQNGGFWGRFWGSYHCSGVVWPCVFHRGSSSDPRVYTN